MIKLIVSDVDGTLAPDGSPAIDPAYYDMILKLHEKGIHFAVASGRPVASVTEAFEPIKEQIFYIANNGAYVGCRGRSLFVNAIEPTLVRELLDTVREHPSLSAIYAAEDGDYMDSSDDGLYRWMRDGYKFNIHRVMDLRDLTQPCVKLSIYKAHNLKEEAAGIRKLFEDRMKVTMSGEMWMDCMAKGVCKGWAVQTLQESLDIRPEETLVFGDQQNDLEMLGRAYYSFAVANATDEVRRAARFQADSAKNLGVLKVLGELL